MHMPHMYVRHVSACDVSILATFTWQEQIGGLTAKVDKASELIQTLASKAG